MANAINILMMSKGEHTYILIYNQESRSAVPRAIGKFAANPELGFTWYDAAVWAQQVREFDREANFQAGNQVF